MAGTNERDLLGSMGRIPDNTYQLDERDQDPAMALGHVLRQPGHAPMYHRAGRDWVPMGGFPPTLVREGCIVEWTVTNGATQDYRWQGNGCRTVTLVSTPPP